MTKVVMLGWSPIGEGFAEVFCKIHYNEEKDRLSICGVEGPQVGGDCIGCGQIVEHIDEEYIINLRLSPHWTLDMLHKFLTIWRKYHLNDMRPDCEHQRALGWKVEQLGKPCPICGYKYGSRWNYLPIPKEIIGFLKGLPDAEKKPAWI